MQNHPSLTFFPRTSIVWFPNNRIFWKNIFTSVRNGLMREIRCADQIVHIEEFRRSFLDVFRCDRIKVMDVDRTMNYVTLNTEIASVVTNYDPTPGSLPLGR